MKKIKAKDFQIKNLGKTNQLSPLGLSTKYGDKLVNYVNDKERILYDDSYEKLLTAKNIKELITFEKAGPREKLFFNPSISKAAIVTCGGLCPGLNDVIRSIVMELYYRYGTKSILGIKYGYRGFISKYNYKPLELTPEKVSDIHFMGGTILGSSRGKQDTSEIVDFLIQNNISILFCIGGDGTLRGAQAISDEINKRKLKISIIGIPKTIDNDISYIDRTFGFQTAFSKAVDAIKTAHCEAKGTYNGIGIVKVMGRHSGYIAANAALALREVNFVLIPELPFDLEGDNGLFHYLKKRLDLRHHAVIVIAEGAGQNFLIPDISKAKRDASGNLKLGDIGIFLKNKIKTYFQKINFDFSIKYIDPSYMIRSLPAVPTDSIFCGSLGSNAVHAALAGKTEMVVGCWHNSFVNIPIKMATSKRKLVDLESPFWLSVLEATGQPPYMINE